MLITALIAGILAFLAMLIVQPATILGAIILCLPIGLAVGVLSVMLEL